MRAVAVAAAAGKPIVCAMTSMGRNGAPKNLGDAPAPEAPHEVHLPETVAGHHVAEGPVGIRRARRGQVRDAGAIASHVDGTVEAGKGQALAHAGAR